LQSLQFAHRTTSLLIHEAHLFGALQDKSTGFSQLKPFPYPAEQLRPYLLF
jgi:hypothetical protein